MINLKCSLILDQTVLVYLCLLKQGEHLMNELSVRAPVIVVVAKMLATKGGQRCRHIEKMIFFCLQKF